MINDITNRLKSAFSREASSINNLHNGISITDIEGHIKYVNDIFIKLTGYSEDELIGSKHSLLKSEKHSVTFYQQMNDTLNRGESWRGVVENKTKNGEAYWVDNIISPVFNESEILIGYVSISTDVSELELTKRSYEKALKLQKTLSYIDHLLFTKNKKKDVCQLICKALTEKLNYSVAWLGFGNVSSSGIDNESTKTRLVTYSEPINIESQYLFTFYDFIRVNKETRIVPLSEVKKIKPVENEQYTFCLDDTTMLVGAPIFGPEGDVAGVLICVSSEKLRLSSDDEGTIVNIAEKLSNYHERLALLKSRQYTETQQFEAKKMEAVTRLTAGVAHDFNNILTSIVGYADLAFNKVEEEQPKLKRYINKIHTAGHEGRDVVAKLMTYCRMNRPKNEPMADIDLISAIGETLELVGSSMPASLNIVFRNNARTQEVVVHHDKMALYQILLELISNADDAYKNSGNIIVTIDLLSVEHVHCDSCHRSYSGTYAIVTVEDYGCGMAKNELVNIFSPFYSKKEVGQATGLGLSTAHGLVHNFNGHITVDSQLEQGTKFRLYFPLVDDISTPSVHSNAHRTLTNSFDLPKGTKAIIIDDEEQVLTMLAEQLDYWGIESLEFSSSTKAMEYMKNNQCDTKGAAFEPNVVITDLNMPDISGLELGKQAIATWQSIPVLIITGYNPLAVDESSGYRYLTKPYSNSELLSQLVSMLNDNAVGANA